MKITDIKQQVKRRDRYSVYVDDKYTMSFSEGELLSLALRVGQEVDNNELERLKKASVEDKAYMKAMNLIARRSRSKWEMRQYLTRQGLVDSQQQRILNMLSDRGYLDDEKFATAWINNRRLLKNVSKRRLTQELRQKRVPDEIIESALSADEANEKQVLKELAAKKRQQSRYQDRDKLMAYLLRQGFNFGDVKSIIDEI